MYACEILFRRCVFRDWKGEESGTEKVICSEPDLEESTNVWLKTPQAHCTFVRRL